MLKLEPALLPIANRIPSGVYFPDDTTGDAARFTAGLANRFMSLRGTTHLNTQIESLLGSTSWVTGIASQKRQYLGDAVVVAAYASTQRLNPLGVRLSIKGVKSYSLTMDASGIEIMPRIPVVNQAMHAAINPLGSRIRVAGTTEFTQIQALYLARRESTTSKNC